MNSSPTLSLPHQRIGREAKRRGFPASIVSTEEFDPSSLPHEEAMLLYPLQGKETLQILSRSFVIQVTRSTISVSDLIQETLEPGHQSYHCLLRFISDSKAIPRDNTRQTYDPELFRSKKLGSKIKDQRQTAQLNHTSIKPLQHLLITAQDHHSCTFWRRRISCKLHMCSSFGMLKRKQMGSR
ncbi:Uncharacterized protein Rs2_01226 [Raphanus sativus]|nr:Uncharacterized protein Rs2_01226 [Raphanus sativus]